MDEQFLEALQNLNITLTSLPTLLVEVLNGLLPSISFSLPKSKSHDAIFDFSIKLQELSKQALDLTNNFQRISDFLEKIKLPVNPLSSAKASATIVYPEIHQPNLKNFVLKPFFSQNGNLPDFGKFFRSFLALLKPVQIQLPSPPALNQLPAPDSNNVNQAAPGTSIIGFGLKAVISSDSLNQINATVGGFGAISENLLAALRKLLSGLPGAFSGLLARGLETLPGLISGAGRVIGKTAAAIAIPGGALAIEGQIENLRRQALEANALNANLGQYSGTIFTENARFNFGQFHRTRVFAHQTEESAAMLSRATNAMENAFLPFDVLRRDIGNKIGTIKANIAGSFAKNVLTPIVDLYDSAGDLIKKGLSSDSLLTQIGTLGGSLLPGVIAGALLGSRFGLAGAALGGLGGGITSALAIMPDQASKILGNAATFGGLGSIAGTVLGGIGGFFAGGPAGILPGSKLGMMAGGGLGGVFGAVKGAWDQTEAEKIQKGPWMDFINNAKNERPLRLPLKAPAVPNRFQRVR